MVMYSSIWCCIGMYGDVQGCMEMYRGCMVMYRGVWCCIWVYGDV